MSISDAWKKSRQDVIQTSVMIEDTLRQVTLMSCAAAIRETDIKKIDVIRDDNVSSLVRKGYKVAVRRRTSRIRLRLLKQERGRPPERVLVITPVTAPLRERRTPKTSSRAIAVGPTPAQDAETIGPRAQDSEVLAQVSGLKRTITRLEAERDEDHERMEGLARMVEALRQRFRAANGDPPTDPGLPSI